MAKHPRFEMYKGKNGKHYFRLTAKNGQTILTSQGYAGAAGCRNGIASVRKNAPLDERYDRKTAKNGQVYFTLLAGNRQVIGSSEMYKSKASRDNGIASVKTNGPIAEIHSD